MQEKRSSRSTMGFVFSEWAVEVFLDVHDQDPPYEAISVIYPAGDDVVEV